MTYKLPELPENQKWSVRIEFNTFLILYLKEKRWWGWKTIAKSTDLASGGNLALSKCVDHIVNRDYYGRIRKEAADRKAKTRAELNRFERDYR